MAAASPVTKAAGRAGPRPLASGLRGRQGTGAGQWRWRWRRAALALLTVAAAPSRAAVRSSSMAPHVCRSSSDESSARSIGRRSTSCAELGPASSPSPEPACPRSWRLSCAAGSAYQRQLQVGGPGLRKAAGHGGGRPAGGCHQERPGLRLVRRGAEPSVSARGVRAAGSSCEEEEAPGVGSSSCLRIDSNRLSQISSSTAPRVGANACSVIAVGSGGGAGYGRCGGSGSASVGGGRAAAPGWRSHLANVLRDQRGPGVKLYGGRPAVLLGQIQRPDLVVVSQENVVVLRAEYVLQQRR